MSNVSIWDNCPKTFTIYRKEEAKYSSVVMYGVSNKTSLSGGRNLIKLSWDNQSGLAIRVCYRSRDTLYLTQ
jgi:hypothetical protein